MGNFDRTDLKDSIATSYHWIIGQRHSLQTNSKLKIQIET